MITFKSVSKYRPVTYLGRVCDMQEFQVAGKLGKRVVVRRWRDTGDVEFRAIEGDGRTANFREFGTETHANFGGMEVINKALELAQRYWG